MRSFVLVLFAAVLSSPAFAGEKANYSFFADSSKVEAGSCVQSILNITQVSNLLLVSDSAEGTSEILKLNDRQVLQFKKLADRQIGESVQVKAAIGQRKVIFKGETCGRLLCDSVEITSGAGATENFEQPVHGLSAISCNR